VTSAATDRFVADQRSARREQRGWYFYDWASSAFSTTVITVFLGPYLTSVAQAAADAGEQVTLLGIIPVAPESYFPFMVSISVALQVILLPLVGGLADVSSKKKYVMAGGAYVGALAVMAMFFLDGTRYQLGGVLFLLANVAFGASLVVYNSFLPDIAKPDERDGVSSRAWAMGYVGGLILLVANLVLFLGHCEDSGNCSRNDWRNLRIAVSSKGNSRAGNRLMASTFSLERWVSGSKTRMDSTSSSKSSIR